MSQPISKLISLYGDMAWVYVLLIAVKGFVTVSSVSCDINIQTTKEGYLGETGIFPWLGVLRVHIHDGHTFRVALTGLVLVQKGFAIVNADDVVKIPKSIFKYDSKAMFIPRDGKAWFCGLVDYMTHPEYEYATMNTIALVELDPEDELFFPMKPICWPPNTYNKTRDLHAIAFTDDNKQLEKSFYSLQHVERERCDAFYNRAELATESRMTPTHYVCGYAARYKNTCVWDNGVVLASNTTKYWALIGFGVRGPGCASPTRFIDITQYLPWIETVTTDREDKETEQTYRKSAFDEGFKKKVRAGESQMDFVHPDMDLVVQHLYPFDARFVQNQYFTVDRIDEKAIEIRNVTLPIETGRCTPTDNVLLYHEKTKIFTQDKGSVSYRLSMYDLAALNYSCTKISVQPVHCKDEASLYYSTTIDNTEALSFAEYGVTPEKILKVAPIHPVKLRPANMTDDQAMINYTPGPHLKALFINDDDTPILKIENYNIYFKIQFENLAVITVEVLGHMKPLLSSTTPTTTIPWLRAREEEEDDEAKLIEAKIERLETHDTESSSKTESTSKTKTDKLEPQRSFRVLTPANLRFLNKSVLFSAGEKLGALSLRDIITIEVFVLCMSGIWFNDMELY